ncbi:MAG: precorrin-2 C(20)-methyltransferase [Synergistaceae bacterium]|nr:precorrin-2 C(20)-methyltransferase [Synergistaceae bacterium]MBQ6970752.1 precorrin-2 C(20)-methyltransferase [Synergistaceae bacterium]
MTAVTIAGIGPGDPELVTLSAIHEAEISDVILAPRSAPDRPGIAENIITHHFPHRHITPLFFPMTQDQTIRHGIILSQLEDMRTLLADRITFFPVLGDSTLYSTGCYVAQAMSELFPDLDVNIIPGISAHSLASAYVSQFLAMNDEALTIIPGTAPREKINATIHISDTVAIYKPSAIDDIRGLIDPAEFSTVIRADHIGIPGHEDVFIGPEALDGLIGYMSVIILKR